VKEAEKAGKRATLRIFPPFGASAQDGHEFCVRGAHLWADDVFAFLSTSIGP
jgi:hypothetical protein